MSCFWGHRWKIVGVDHGTIIKTDAFTSAQREAGEGSDIKSRCEKCGETKTVLRSGHWTAKELGLEEK